jgi:hypothetical protein
VRPFYDATICLIDSILVLINILFLSCWWYASPALSLSLSSRRRETSFDSREQRLVVPSKGKSCSQCHHSGQFQRLSLGQSFLFSFYNFPKWGGLLDWHFPVKNWQHLKWLRSRFPHVFWNISERRLWRRTKQTTTIYVAEVGQVSKRHIQS